MLAWPAWLLMQRNAPLLLLLGARVCFTAKPAHIGLILPQTTSVGEPFPGVTWKQVVCASRLAVHHVNTKNETVVPNLASMAANLSILTANFYDTGYSARPAVVAYRQLKADGATAMVAAARSAVSMPLALLGGIDQMPQCSYWSSSPDLSNTQLYPYCESFSAPFVGGHCTSCSSLA